MYYFVNLETKFDSETVVETLVVATYDVEDSAAFLHPEITTTFFFPTTNGSHEKQNIRSCVTTLCGVRNLFLLPSDLTNGI
jgi:hypothetical protein